MKKIVAIIRLLWAKNYILLAESKRPKEWVSMWDITTFKGAELDYLAYVIGWLENEQLARLDDLKVKRNED